MMKSKPLRDEAPEDLLGVGALGHVLDVGDVRVGHVLADVDEAFVVGLAPAAVVVGPDEDHGDVELALDDLGDLRPGGRAGLALSRRRSDGARGWRGRAARRAGAHQERPRREQRQGRPESAGHRVLSSKRSPWRFGAAHPGRWARHADRRRGPEPGPDHGPRIVRARPPPKGRWAPFGGRDGPRGAVGATARHRATARGRRRPGRRVSATLPPDVRTHGAARRAARHLRAAPRLPVGHDRGARAGRLAPRGRRPGRLRPLHGAPDLQGDARATRRRARSPRPWRGSAGPSTPRPTARRPSTTSACRSATPPSP